ncbi:CDK-activating kinase assembly factor [Sodiomyces alkalinus F11]|uniref:RNA polymerase II transcription factor B subunit 3 n=1 Tax=Sodiomyces alkalinus (strain CBS 110278 / VKM F-3762 / F11) TaxID=1314773 RepID=A0A3N2PZR2_SODAK|nr:CDK-activating kinase assembly factor [Sodiomyces alkalinus F11]ROT39916.1 CDK-activating kinase assembly factor [Sodiomyces alkalinus F11]
MASQRPGAPPSPNTDICPVCKTMRYLNRDLEFLINPECYHPMCANCVARIFADGPAQCPYAGCQKTLRKKAFKAAYFGNLAVEREVDIRRRVHAVFNKEEPDFESLADYNAYLEQVEELTFNLVSGNPDQRSKAEAEMRDWEAKHKSEIEERRRQARESEAQRLAREREAKDAARRRRLDAAREDAEEKARDAREREEILDTLATGDASHARATMQKVALKKRGQHRLDAARSSLLDAASSNLSIRGLKKDKKREAVDEGPYDPFGGLDLALQRYTLGPLDGYRNDWVDAARSRSDIVVGGYSAEEYLSRAMFEAFSGMGVFIEDEKGDGELATREAAQAAAATSDTAQKMDVDVFA